MAGEDISYGQSISGVPGCSAVEGKMALLRYMDHELKCMAWLISQGPEMREIRRLGKRRSGVGSCGWDVTPAPILKTLMITVFTVSPSICHEVMGLDDMILVF